MASRPGRVSLVESLVEVADPAAPASASLAVQGFPKTCTIVVSPLALA
jgi:hypothetical protein